MSEDWRPVVGYEGLYEVSDRGRVRRVAPGRRTWPGRILRFCLKRDGYATIRLTRDGRQRTILAHRLVAEAFLGPCPVGHQVNHRDGVKLNNTVCNLEYVTRSENQQHAVRLGLLVPVPPIGKRKHYGKGPEGPGAKLTAEQAAEIRRVYAEGLVEVPALACRYGVGRTTIYRVVKGRSYQTALDSGLVVAN